MKDPVATFLQSSWLTVRSRYLPMTAAELESLKPPVLLWRTVDGTLLKSSRRVNGASRWWWTANPNLCCRFRRAGTLWILFHFFISEEFLLQCKIVCPARSLRVKVSRAALRRLLSTENFTTYWTKISRPLSTSRRAVQVSMSENNIGSFVGVWHILWTKAILVFPCRALKIYKLNFGYFEADNSILDFLYQGKLYSKFGLRSRIWTAKRFPVDCRGPPVGANKTEIRDSWTPEISGNFLVWTLEQKVRVPLFHRLLPNDDDCQLAKLFRIKFF